MQNTLIRILGLFNEDQTFRGMIIENLSQRYNEFLEESENVKAIFTYLNDNSKMLSRLRESRNLSESQKKHPQMNKATAGDVVTWLKLENNNKKGIFSIAVYLFV